MYPLPLITDKVLNKGKNEEDLRKKHLTGNAYYAAKAGKRNEKQRIFITKPSAAKGGRPRIYNVDIKRSATIVKETDTFMLLIQRNKTEVKQCWTCESDGEI